MIVFHLPGHLRLGVRRWIAACASLLLCLSPTLGPALAAQVDVELARLLSSEDPEVWDRAVAYLSEQPVARFSGSDKMRLGQALAQKQVANFPELIRIAGAVGDLELLEAVSPEARAIAGIRQEISLAKVRAGSEERTENLLKNLDGLEIDDDYVDYLLPDLIYTRSRPVFDYLWQRTVVPNNACTPLDSESSAAIDCAYRMVEALGRATEGFPVPLDFEGLLDTDDYPAALQRIRRWYSAHADTYVIDRTEIN